MDWQEWVNSPFGYLVGAGIFTFLLLAGIGVAAYLGAW